jgi:hypothetical protein
VCKRDGHGNRKVMARNVLRPVQTVGGDKQSRNDMLNSKGIKLMPRSYAKLLCVDYVGLIGGPLLPPNELCGMGRGEKR